METKVGLIMETNLATGMSPHCHWTGTEDVYAGLQGAPEIIVLSKLWNSYNYTANYSHGTHVELINEAKLAL